MYYYNKFILKRLVQAKAWLALQWKRTSFLVLTFGVGAFAAILVVMYFTVAQPINTVAEIQEDLESYAEQRDDTLAELAYLSFLETQAEYNFYLELSGNESLAAALLGSTDVPPSLALALVERESSFNPRAIGRNSNGSRDYGLFQLNSSVYRAYTASELLQQKLNIELGLRHLAYALDWSNGNVQKALWAYNAGASRANPYEVPETTIAYALYIQKRSEEIEEGKKVAVAREKHAYFTK